MALIKCSKCNNDVSDKAKKCPHCGIIINDKNSIENILNEVKLKKESSDNTFNRRIYNKVANKFNIVVIIMKFLGYFAGFIAFIVSAQNNNFGIGLLVCLATCICTWLSTLLFEAIAEGLQLLEDIKNK